MQGLLSRRCGYLAQKPSAAWSSWAEGEKMRSAQLQELEEMAAKLSATAGELPPGQDHHNALREIAKFRVQIAALQGARGINDEITSKENEAAQCRKNRH
jgi:hypothetical protein